MQISSNNSAEDMTYSTLLESYEADFNAQFVDLSGPDDEDNEEEEEDGGNESDNANDPPLDEEVVHSPVPTERGGMPKK